MQVCGIVCTFCCRLWFFWHSAKEITSDIHINDTYCMRKSYTMKQKWYGKTKNNWIKLNRSKVLGQKASTEYCIKFIIALYYKWYTKRNLQTHTHLGHNVTIRKILHELTRLASALCCKEVGVWQINMISTWITTSANIIDALCMHFALKVSFN